MDFGWKKGKYDYPIIGYYLGLTINFLPVILVFGVGLYILKQHDWSIEKSILPSEAWQPNGLPFDKRKESRNIYSHPSVAEGRDIYRKLSKSQAKNFSTKDYPRK